MVEGSLIDGIPFDSRVYTVQLATSEKESHKRSNIGTIEYLEVRASNTGEDMPFSLHLEKSAQKAFTVLRIIRRTFSRITRTDFQILYGAYVRPLLEYANQVVYSGRTNDVILIGRVQRTAIKMVAGLKSVDY
ncbi:hypothetical protein CLF_112475 [Clonorchis sinensis]|uniref:Uncharacterized protein n=1 Tax=Clonorchis sinensis TaxID=79923 RepID=G7YWF4_CLOSI|nr:hypothetical protein CLF_112475 [Clonorchis sinensis]